MNDSGQQIDLPSRKPFKRAAICISLFFHFALIGALALWYVNRRSETKDEAVAQNNQSDPTPARRVPNPPPPSPDVTSTQVNNTLDRMHDIHEEKTDEENLSALEEKAAELEKLASEESIDEIAAKFQEWTNIQSRASVPATEPVEGDFEFDTAQLHDVKKVESEDGTVVYRSTLVDAQGRTFEVEMSGEEGETAYRTMATLKRFPLADRVYRQIAMPLIDQAAASAPANSATAAGDAEEDDRDPFDGQLDDAPENSEEPEQEAEISNAQAG